MDDLKSYIREVRDFPKPGINFYDITTLMKDALGLKMTVDRLTWLFLGERVDKVVGMESRGFIFAPIVAAALNAGFVPVRKPGKLPAATVQRSYELEYGSDSLEMHSDAVASGERVLVIDDLIATGGTALATAEMVEAAGAEVAGMGFVIELEALGGRAKLGDRLVRSLIRY
ncbi:MAG: adenine phosphoribosyltransferase [Thermoanaerobaculia bacterium]|nr:adenine phosphoribosyltransferase [Thermoanaerobaculia bacterium]